MKNASQISGILIGLLFLLFIFPALIPDEDYLDGAAQWIKDANTHEVLPDEVNRFNALAGFNTDADKDMVVEGARLVAEVNELLDSDTKNNEDGKKLNNYWNKPPLIASEDLTSNTTAAFDNEPVQWLSENQELYSALLKSNRVLLERLRKLMTMKKYSYTMKLDIHVPFVPYRNFLAVKRLNNLSIINQFSSDDKKSAIKDLQKSISFSKLMLKQSVSLIDKMIAAEFLKIDLHTYSAILDIWPVDKIPMFLIKNLKKDERSMHKVFKREYAFISTSFDTKNTNSFDGYSTESPLFENIFMKLYLKPKRMNNKAYKDMWIPFLDLENQRLSLRKEKSDEVTKNMSSWSNMYMDPIGYILMNIATPSYFEYIDRVDHADATISLLNLKASIYLNKTMSNNIIGQISSTPAEMNAGYKGAKFSWDNKKVLSYDIPDYTGKRIPRLNLHL